MTLNAIQPKPRIMVFYNHRDAECDTTQAWQIGSLQLTVTMNLANAFRYGLWQLDGRDQLL